MRPLPFVWPYALVFWAVYIWAFLPEWKIVQGGIEGAKGADSRNSAIHIPPSSTRIDPLSLESAPFAPSMPLCTIFHSGRNAQM